MSNGMDEEWEAFGCGTFFGVAIAGVLLWIFS